MTLGLIVLLVGIILIAAGGVVQQSIICSEFTVNEAGIRVCADDLPEFNVTLMISGSIIAFIGLIIIVIGSRMKR